MTPSLRPVYPTIYTIFIPIALTQFIIFRDGRNLVREVLMQKRICDCCGKEKDVEGGKTCENGHFICKDCVYSEVGFLGFGPVKKNCPIDGKPLR